MMICYSSSREQVTVKPKPEKFGSEVFQVKGKTLTLSFFPSPQFAPRSLDFSLVILGMQLLLTHGFRVQAEAAKEPESQMGYLGVIFIRYASGPVLGIFCGLSSQAALNTG
jgi:hypothetical protein